jgi:hypothetical protein
MRSLVAALGLAVLVVLGCASPTPTTAPIAPTTAAPTPTSVAPPPTASSDLGADLVIDGTGTIPCPIPGCRASIELISGLRPGESLPLGFQPVGGWDFEVMPDGQFETAGIGPVRDAPRSIDTGTYRVVAAASIVSDTPSGEPDASGHYPLVLMGWDLCEAPLIVTPGVTSVRIVVVFSKGGGCRVTTGVAVP